MEVSVIYIKFVQDPSNLAVRLSSPPDTATKIVSVVDSSKVPNSASSRMGMVPCVESKVAKVANSVHNKKVKQVLIIVIHLKH